MMDILFEIVGPSGIVCDIRSKLQDLIITLQEDNELMKEMKEKCERLEEEKKELIRGRDKMKIDLQHERELRKKGEIKVEELQENLINERKNRTSFSLREVQAPKSNVNEANNVNTEGDIRDNENCECDVTPWILKEVVKHLDAIKELKTRAVHETEFITHIQRIKQDMKRERAMNRDIINDSLTTIEKVKVKMEFGWHKSRRIINKNIRQVAEFKIKVKCLKKKLHEIEIENEKYKRELTKYQQINKSNKEELSKYKDYYLDRIVAYSWMILDLTNLENLLPTNFICFPRNKSKHNIIRRVRGMLTEGMVVTQTVKPLQNQNVEEL